MTIPIGTTESRGVHPGAIVLIGDRLCTEDFLFKGSDGARYIATAGHCVLAHGSQTPQNQGEHVWGPGQGQMAQDSQQHRIGTVAYAGLDPSHDFALIRLDPHTPASSKTATFGGPTGVNSTRTSGPQTLDFFGNGIGIGNARPARSAVAPNMQSPTSIDAQGAATDGDSGSPVQSSDRRAVGLVSTYSIPDQGQNSQAGSIGIVRIGPQVSTAQRALSTRLELQTAPRR